MCVCVNALSYCTLWTMVYGRYVQHESTHVLLSLMVPCPTCNSQYNLSGDCLAFRENFHNRMLTVCPSFMINLASVYA